MKKIIVGLVFLNLLVGFNILSAAGLCEDETFEISTTDSDGLVVGDLLNQLATECGYSVLVKDRAAKEKLTKSIASVNIRYLPLEKIFDLLLTENELNYEFDGNLLKVSFLVTETFQINYIGTSRAGSSSTDIVLSQNSMSSSQNTSSSSGTGSSGLSSGGSNNNTMQADVHRSVVNNTMQSSSTDSVSGTKITSVDEFDFWGKIEKELFEIAFRPGDSYQPKRIFSDTTATSTEGSSTAATAENATAESVGDGQSIIINKIAGLITVTGTIKQLERVRKYIKNLEDQLQNQVLIDVNILTVTHNDSNTVGVDWNQMWNLGNFTIPNQSGSTSTSGLAAFTIGDGMQVFSSGLTLTRVIEFLNSYGKTRSVSNPKVLTLSNQPALISVGSILRYTQQSSYITATSSGSNTTSDTEYPALFSGVLLDVTPSVQGEYIMLKINPSITRTKDLSSENQATALSEPPNLSANQLSSLVRVKDGEKVVIGGLISKSVSNATSRVPVLGYIPILKYLFSYDSLAEETTEMIIVITPHIVKRNDVNPSLQDLGYSETVNEIIETNDVKAGFEEFEENK